MKRDIGTIIFGIIEIAVGAITLMAVITSLILGQSQKPLEVLIFVLTTASISLGLGIGILRRSLTGYHLLLFFSTVVIFSKILIFAKIIALSGALEATIPSSLKNIVSIIYHILLICYFSQNRIRKYFKERRNVLFSLQLPSFEKFKSKIQPILTILDFILEAGILAAVFIFILLMAHRAITDPDIWLHLKTGEVIYQNRSVPAQDIFSFTFQGKPWIDHEWLFQLCAYLIFTCGGPDMLITLQASIIILLFLVLYFIGHRNVERSTFLVLFILVAAFAANPRFNIRPDIFSMLFFCLYLYFLKYHYDKDLIYLLIPIQILWVNLHGFFFLGPLLIFLFILGESLRRRIRILPWQWKKQFILTDAEYDRLCKAFLLSLAACLINPAFVKGALYPISILQDMLMGKTHIIFKHILELQLIFKIPWDNIFMKAYYVLLIFTFLAMLVNFKKLRIVDIILFIFFFFFSFRIRNIAFFSFLAYTLIVDYLPRAASKISTNTKLDLSFKKTLMLLSLYLGRIFIIIWFAGEINESLKSRYYNFDRNEFESTHFGIVEQDLYPRRAVDFILKNDIPGNMLNDFNSGAYLVGKVYPKRKVFIDGRTEVYGQDFFKQTREVYEGKSAAFEAVSNKYNITAVLANISRGHLHKLIEYLYKDRKWKLVFVDEAGAVFLKDVPMNHALIQTYKIDFKKYTPPPVDIKVLGTRRLYPFAYLRRASLLELIGEDDAVIQETKEAIHMMPGCSDAYRLLGKAYLRKKMYKEAFEKLRITLLFSPGNIEAHHNMGISLKELKEFKLAISAFKGVLEINTYYAPAYYQLGDVYLTLKEIDKAIGALNKAIKYATSEPTYHYKLAEALCQKAKISKDKSFLRKAEEEFNQALKLADKNERLSKEIKDKLGEIKNQI